MTSQARDCQQMRSRRVGAGAPPCSRRPLRASGPLQGSGTSNLASEAFSPRSIEPTEVDAVGIAVGVQGLGSDTVFWRSPALALFRSAAARLSDLLGIPALRPLEDRLYDPTKFRQTPYSCLCLGCSGHHHLVVPVPPHISSGQSLVALGCQASRSGGPWPSAPPKPWNLGANRGAPGGRALPSGPRAPVAWHAWLLLRECLFLAPFCGAGSAHQLGCPACGRTYATCCNVCEGCCFPQLPPTSWSLQSSLLLVTSNLYPGPAQMNVPLAFLVSFSALLQSRAAGRCGERQLRRETPAWGSAGHLSGRQLSGGLAAGR